MLVAMAAVRVDRARARFRTVSRWLCIPICLLIVFSSAIRFVPSLFQPGGPRFAAGASTAMRLATLLGHERLAWGYASWWNAGATTILSGTKSRVSPLVFDRGRMAMFPVMRQSEWYADSSWKGETFLALSLAEQRYQPNGDRRHAWRAFAYRDLE